MNNKRKIIAVIILILVRYSPKYDSNSMFGMNPIVIIKMNLLSDNDDNPEMKLRISTGIIGIAYNNSK